MSEVVLKLVVVLVFIFVCELLLWVVFVGLILLFVFYFVGVEQGVMLFVLGMYVYEFVYDGCYLFGFFCY